MENPASFRLSRRAMVGLLAAGGAAVLLPVGLVARVGVELPKGLKLRFLSEMEAATLLAAWRVVLTKEDQARYSGGEAGFLKETDEMLWLYPPHLQSDLKLAFGLARFSPVFSLKARPLHALTQEEAFRAVNGLLNSSLLAFRQVGEALVQLVHFVYYGDPGAWKPLGYEGPMVGL